MRSFGRVAGLLVSCSGSAAPGGGRPAHGKPEPPKRVLILVLDQFRPDYVDTFGMTNVRALMRDGVNFPNAYLGHMASETVITPQRDHQRPAPGAHGLVRRGVPRRRRRARARRTAMYVSGSLTATSSTR